MTGQNANGKRPRENTPEAESSTPEADEVKAKKSKSKVNCLPLSFWSESVPSEERQQLEELVQGRIFGQSRQVLVSERV
jgi:hypothetical protein